MRLAGLALAAVLGAFASGCGGGDSASPSGSNSIAVRDFEFSPAEFTVAAGGAVTWKNEGEQIHNVKGEGFFSRAIDAGDSYSFTFERPGSYDYVCTLHPQMKAKIVVQ